MKFLLYLAILGAGLWILTEILEISSATGSTPLSLWLTSIWHPVLALGFYGLHRGQSFPRNLPSMAGVILIIISLLGFAPVSILMMQKSVATFPAMLEMYPILKTFGLVSVIGYAIFCISMLRTKYYPKWMAYALFACVLLALLQALAGLPEFVQHIAFISQSAVIISMAGFVLRE